MHGLTTDPTLEAPERYFTLESYEGGVARWCPACGDHAVLSAVQKICRDAQVPTEKLVAVSGIGCSSRFPHYMHAYGFHGLHGRALPVACGVKARRPDLHVWVATGDGDCCSIGAGHWLHAARYNMDMTVMLFDNRIYGLTKKQTSPTSPVGLVTNTHPAGAWLPPLDVLQTTLGFTNISFVARTVDWNPLHLYRTLQAAYEHRGFSFVHILQRCPAFTEGVFEELRANPDLTLLLTHERGIPADPAVERLYRHRLEHDPADLGRARELAATTERLPIGLFYRNPEAPRYETFTEAGLGMTADEKVANLERELDRFAI
ncbi:MAG TPA: thiamine pyrophosphate-dependent enzyme [Thermoanaerobaculia bacterium]|nr:thiamine pyrophosphate-dependent enzyme [Thermoanaerobaculia bacterium]